MGGITINIPNIFHMNAGSLLGLALHVHLGSANFDTDLDEAGDQEQVLDLFRYAKEANHTTRDGGFDTKAAALWGTQYSGLDAAYKDAIFLNTRQFPFTPWPPP